MRKMVPRKPVKAHKSRAVKNSSQKQSSSPPVPSIDARHACFKLNVRPSKIHRWGVYAGEDIPARRKVIEYTGEKISRKETKRRSEQQDKMIYLFTLDNYWTLDGAVGGSGAEYINHCCDPNIVTEIRKGHILYYSRRPIRRGQELTVDYHFGKDIEEVPCSCGATACRGTINLK
jgi:SET domain-containing protein